MIVREKTIIQAMIHQLQMQLVLHLDVENILLELHITLKDNK